MHPHPWRTDPGWQALIHPLPLRNLSPEESQTYLTRAVPATQHNTVLISPTVIPRPVTGCGCLLRDKTFASNPKLRPM